MLALAGRLLGGTAKLALKYLLVPVLVSVATAIVADEVAKRMRHRTAELNAQAAGNAEAAGVIEQPRRVRFQAVVAA